MGRTIAHLFEPQRAGDEILAGRPLGTQSPPVDRTVLVALYLHDLLVLDEDLLSATAGAVGAHAARDQVGGGGARLDRLRLDGARGVAAAKEIGTEQCRDRAGQDV